MKEDMTADEVMETLGLRKPQKMTNGDKLRLMSNEELAEWFQDTDFSWISGGYKRESIKVDTYERLINFLNSEEE